MDSAALKKLAKVYADLKEMVVPSNVQIKRRGTLEWTPYEEGSEVMPEDLVRTRRSPGTVMVGGRPVQVRPDSMMVWPEQTRPTQRAPMPIVSGEANFRRR